MWHSLTGHSAGRIFSGLISKRGLAHIATMLSVAIAGLTTGARAAPVTVSWDAPFCSTTSSGQLLRGHTQTLHCLHPFVDVTVGGGMSKTNYDVAPSFDVNGSGFIFGISGGVLVDIPGTIFSVGPRIGWQGGNMSGSIANPPASPSFLYDVKRTSTFYQEMLLQVPINLGNPTQQPNMFPFVAASAGIAEVKLQFNGTSGAFQVTDSPTSLGFTGTLGFGIPIYQSLPDGTLAVFTEARFIKTDSFDVTLPGKFKSNYQSTSVSAGFRYQW